MLKMKEVMGVSSCVSGGQNEEIEFPPGFRFCPCSWELIHYYVKNKNDGVPLPIQIPVADIYECHPERLPGSTLSFVILHCTLLSMDCVFCVLFPTSSFKPTSILELGSLPQCTRCSAPPQDFHASLLHQCQGSIPGTGGEMRRPLPIELSRGSRFHTDELVSQTGSTFT